MVLVREKKIEGRENETEEKKMFSFFFFFCILIVLMEGLKLLKHKETFLFIQSQSYLMYIFGYCKFLFAINFECGG